MDKLKCNDKLKAVVYAKKSGMRLLPVLIGLILFSISCKKNSCQPDYSSYVFESNKQLNDTSVFYGPDSVHTYAEAAGNDLVFKYSFGKGRCNNAEDTYSQLLNFQISSSLTEFEYKDSSLLNIKCFYFLSEVGHAKPEKISRGLIKGSRINSTRWNITVQVQPDFGYDLSFNKIFTLAQ